MFLGFHTQMMSIVPLRLLVSHTWQLLLLLLISQHMAIASPAGNHENGVDGLSSVKTVLDFNFPKCLVRISMELVSC